MDLAGIMKDLGAGGMGAFLTTLAFVLLAEMGDKTQLLVMAFATRYKLRQVIIGVVFSIAVLNALAVLMGEIVTRIIPLEYIKLLASVSFIVFGIMAFKKDEGEEEAKTFKFGATLAVALSFFIAELGDKTQLATMALAAQYRAPVQVFLGAVLAMVIADMLGLIVGAALNKYIPQRHIKTASGLMFIGFGLFGLAELAPREQISTIADSTAIIAGIGALAVIFLLMVFSSKPKKAK